MVHTYVMEKELLQEKASPWSSGLLADYLIWRERGNLEWREQGLGKVVTSGRWSLEQEF